MTSDTTLNLSFLALPLATLVMAIVSAVFGWLNWRSEGARRRAEARRVRLEATIADLAELFAAIPHDKSKWSETYTKDFIEKVCMVDFKLDKDNPLTNDLVKAIQEVLPRELQKNDADHMAKYNKARTLAKDYLDLEWQKFKIETGMKQ